MVQGGDKSAVPIFTAFSAFSEFFRIFRIFSPKSQDGHPNILVSFWASGEFFLGAQVIQKAKIGQNVTSKCHLDQFTWGWAIIGDFFPAVFCLGLGPFFAHSLTMSGQIGDFSKSQKFRPHFSAFSAFFIVLSLHPPPP